MNTGYQATKQFFKDVNWKYETAENVFRSDVELETSQYATIHIDTDDTMIVVFTALQYKIKERLFDKILRMVNVLNMLNPVGSVFLDVEERMILCRFGQVYPKQNMTADDVGAQVSFVLDVIERISKVLPKLEDGTHEPEEVALLVIAPEDAEE
ncbi:MAG: hypothetical protein V3G42_10105 [Oscillospiraceae bacterium]